MVLQNTVLVGLRSGFSPCVHLQNQIKTIYMNDDVGTMENSDEDEQRQPESSDEVKGNDDDEIGTDDGVDIASESHGLTTTQSQTTEQQAPKDCPYALKKKIKLPAMTHWILFTIASSVHVVH